MPTAPIEQKTGPVTLYSLPAIPGPIKRIPAIPRPTDYISAGHPLWPVVGRLGAILWQELHDGKGHSEPPTDAAIRRRGLELMRSVESMAPHVRSVIDATLVLHSIVNEAVGAGPLEPYVRDEYVKEILVVGPHVIYVRRETGLEPVTSHFENWRHMLRVVENLMHKAGHCLLQDGLPSNVRCQDGSLLTVIAAPGVNDGPVMIIDRWDYSSSSKTPR